MRNLSLALVAMLLLMLGACKKDPIHIRDSSTRGNLENRSWENPEITDDEKLEVLAKAVALSQEEPGFMEFVKKEAGKLRGGEEVVLFYSAKDEMVNGEKSLLELMTENINKVTENNFEPEEVFLYYMQPIPNLAVSVYTGPEEVSVEEWNYTEPVKVLASSEAFQTPEETAGITFDVELNEYTISNLGEPEEAVLVVEKHPGFIPIDTNTGKTPGGDDLVNIVFRTHTCDGLLDEIERVIEGLMGIDPVIVNPDFEIIFNPQYQAALMSLNNLVSLYNDMCDTTTPPDPPGGDECDRDAREDDEYIRRMRVDASILSQFCPWYRRWCHIEVHPIFVSRDGNSNGILLTPPMKIQQTRRRDAKQNRIFTSNLSTYNWRFLQGDHADRMAYTFLGRHHNAGGAQTFGFSLGGSWKFVDSVTLTTGFTFQSQKKFRDQELGGDLVEYCDPANGGGTLYSSNMIDVWIKEKEASDP